MGTHSPHLAAADLQYWGKNGGGPSKADPDFDLLASGPVSAHLYLTFVGYWHDNVFGWYQILNGKPVLHALFGGLAYGNSASYPLSADFSPTGEFGLYLQAKDDRIFYSDTALNPAGDKQDSVKRQHFALFKDKNGRT